MTCREFRDLAELLRDGALDAATAAEARAHLESCADCRAFEDETALCLAPVRELPPGPYLPPTSPWRPLPPWLGGGGAAVGVLLALLALGGAAALGLVGPGADAPPQGGAAERATAAAPRPGEANPAEPPTPGPPAPPPPPALPDGAYEGRVVADDGAPVAGAVVTVAGLPPATTDAAGLFSIPGVAPGPSRRMRIEAPGRVPLDGLAPPAWPGARTTLEAVVVGPPRAARIRVVAPDGGPAAGARVRASLVVGELHPHRRPTYRPGADAPSLPVAAEATADADGVAAIAGLAPGIWTFTAALPGCAPGRPETARPGGGGEGPDATILLDTAAPLEGRVVDPDGVPLPGAEVAWLRASDRGNEHDLRHEGAVRAGRDGGFRFDAVPAVPLALSVRHPEGSIRVGALLVDPLVTPVVFVVAGPVVARHGIATDDAGAPAAGAVVEAQALLFAASAAGAERLRVRAGPDGRFVLEGVPRAAAWRLGAARGGGWVERWDPAAFSVGAPEDPLPRLLAATLSRTGGVEGVARAADGSPAPGVEVRAFVPHTMAPQMPMLAALVRADAAGRFRLDGVPAGPALVVPGDGAWDEATGRGLRSFAAPLAEPAGSSPHRVEVPAGGLVAADCPPWPAPPEPRPPPAPARIRGTVRDRDGAPVPGVRLFATFGGPGTPEFLLRAPFARREPVSRDGSFDAAFRFDFAPPPGRGLPVLLLALAPDGRRGRGHATVEAGGAVEGTAVVLEEDRPIEGRLLDPGGSPVEGALLDACPEGDAAAMATMPRAATGADGSFRIRGLPPGAARLFVDRPGHGTVVVPVAADAAMPLEVRLPAPVAIRGRVEGGDGKPAAGVLLRWAPAGVFAMPRFARSAPDGSFAFPAVPRGPYRVHAGSPDPALDDGRFLQESFEFEAAETEPRLVLRPGRSISGSLEDALGAPVAGARIGATIPDGDRPLFRTARTDARGRFTLTGVPAGAEATLDARLGGQRASAGAAEGGAEAALRFPGPVAPGAAPTLLQGRVLDGDGRTPIAAGVRLFDGATGCLLDRASFGGEREFVLDAPRGRTFALEADFGDGECVYLDGLVAGAGPVEVRRGASRGALRGRVVGGDGAPLGGVPVTALLRGPRPDGPIDLWGGEPRIERSRAGVRGTRSAADGSFDLGSPEGRWVVFAGTPGTPASPLAAAAWDGPGTADLELPVGPGWTLRVEGPGDRALRSESAEVRLPGFLPADAAPVVLRLRVGPDGALEVGGLPPVAAEVVLRAGDGREVRRVRVDPP